MATRYLELRSLHKPTGTLAADIAKHIQLRQRLGAAVIVCDNPHALLSATRKQWLRLSRQLQIKRAATLNTEEILRLTHIIVQMQKMTFVAKTPDERPDAQVYYVTATEARSMPEQCFTLYLTSDMPQNTMQLLGAMPNASSIVDYTDNLNYGFANLAPKELLEQQLMHKWEAMSALLAAHNLTPEKLMSHDPTTLPLLDSAIDTLLEISADFLDAAFELQHAVDLAQPLIDISLDQQKVFALITRLAYKVQTLNGRSAQNPIITDSYFLRDCGAEYDDELQAFGMSLFSSPQFAI